MNIPPPDLGNCAVPACTNDATTTRPITGPWITPLGAVLEGDEWQDPRFELRVERVGVSTRLAWVMIDGVEYAIEDVRPLPPGEVPGVDPYGLASSA